MIQTIISWFWKNKRNPGRERRICNLNLGPYLDGFGAEHIDRLKVTNIPESASVKQYDTPIKSQGMYGSCASHACVAWYENMLNHYKPDAFIDGSERYHYWIARSNDFENTYPKDAGMTLNTAFEVLNQVGMTMEQLCPYDYLKINDKPPIFADSMARFWKVKSIIKLYSVDEVCEQIAMGYPVVIGILADKAFINADGKEFAFRFNVKECMGGHALTCVSYNLKEGWVEVKNSWNLEFGKKGYIKIYVDDLKNRWIGAYTARL